MTTDMFIAGGPATGDAPPITVINPMTGGVAATVPAASAAQVDRAVQAAAAAFGEWRDAPQETRSGALRGMAAALESGRETLVDLLTLETGRPRSRNALYVDFAVAVLRQYAELARVHGGRVAPSNDPGEITMALRAPFGVVAALVPWNYPLDLLIFKLAPALAVGNTVVAKGAEETSLTTLQIGELLGPLVPAGVLSVLAGGRDVGEAMVAHDAVDMVAFTGSTGAGRAIAAACAARTIPTHLELGGKDPAIVMPDVDPVTAARGIVWAAFLNAGQVCTSTERAYVHESIHDAVVAEAVRLAEGLRVGDPNDPGTQIGPMRTAAGRARVIAQLDSAVSAGAVIAAGGQALPGDGFFFPPTVVTGVDHSMELMREETFGPVLPIMAVADLDEALTLAADTPYGLGASIYTHDPAAVQRAMHELRVGTLWVNDPVVDNIGAPFGGMRASGNARELGIEGLYAFCTVRHVHWDVHLQGKPWWYTVEE